MCIYIYIVRSLPGSSSRAEVLGGAFGLHLMREARQRQYVGQKPYWFNEQHAEEEREKGMGVHYFCIYMYVYIYVSSVAFLVQAHVLKCWAVHLGYTLCVRRISASTSARSHIGSMMPVRGPEAILLQ